MMGGEEMAEPTVVIRGGCVQDDVLLRPLEDVRQMCLVECVDDISDIVVADGGDAHIIVRHILSCVVLGRDTLEVCRGAQQYQRSRVGREGRSMMTDDDD